MKTLRITVIFLVLALGLTMIVSALYGAFKPGGPIQDPTMRPTDYVQTLIPIACGLIVAPITLRLNRWVERRMNATEKGKR
jgi:hypothetical protein